MIPTQYCTDARIKEIATTELVMVNNRFDARFGARLIVDNDGTIPDAPDAPVRREQGVCYVPCFFKMEYRIADTIRCAVCGSPITTPIEFRRFGYPVCSSECAEESA